MNTMEFQGQSIKSFRTIQIALIVLFTVLVLMVSAAKISDNDLWWHLSLGRQVMATGSIDSPDSFSYTFQGHEQFNAEWLADTLIYLSFASGGFAGIYFLKASVLLLAFLFLFLYLLNHAPEDNRALWSIAVVLGLTVVLFILRWRLFVRPFLFSYLMFAVFLFVLDRADSSGKKSGLLLLPVLEVLWVNISKGAVLGPVLVGIYVVDYIITRRSRRTELLVFGLTLAALLLNPEGIHYYTYLYERMMSSGVVVPAENQPLTPSILWGYGFRYLYMYQIGVVLSLLYFAFRGGWRRPRHVMLFILFFAASLLQRRNMDFFALANCLFMAQAVFWLLKGIKKTLAGRRALVDALAIVVLAFIAFYAVPASKVYSFGLGFKERYIPNGSVEFLQKEHIDGRLFNSFPYGGYITWADLNQKVFIDGRLDQLYPEGFIKQYYMALASDHIWQSLEHQWDYDVVLAEYDQRGFGKHFPRHLTANDQWAVVHWDSNSVVFLKRIPKYQQIIEQYGYQIAQPSFDNFKYLEDVMKQYGYDGAVRRMEHDAAMAPDNQEVLMARVLLLYIVNPTLYREQIVQGMQKILTMKPDTHIEHAFQALLLVGQGQRAEAKKELDKAFAIEPGGSYGNFVKEQYGL